MILILFALILIGLLIGKIRICGVRFGIAGVLLVALVFGHLTSKGSIWDSIVISEICSFLSSIGTALFISAIGLQAGTTFFGKFGGKQLKAFVSGVCMVIVGFAVAVMIGLLDGAVMPDALVGLFSGSMTSTPAMSAGIEVFGHESQVSLGYGMSYAVGVLSVVLFVQVFRLPYLRSTDIQTSVRDSGIMQGSKARCASIFIWLSLSILVGMILAMFLPIGNTGSILISALIFGFICRKIDLTFIGLSAVKSLGLMLFFVGSGISAGQNLAGEIYWIGILYGAMISAISIFGGYLLTHGLFNFSKVESLSIICGGMTSTPAIGALQERDQEVDLSLYSMSYIGALIALITAVRLLVAIFG